MDFVQFMKVEDKNINEEINPEAIPMNIMKEPNEPNGLSFVEMKKIISKVWLTADDIMKLANCGKHSAIDIRNEIEEQIVSSGKKVPKSMYKCVPTNKVLEYLGLEEDYIFMMAERCL